MGHKILLFGGNGAGKSTLGKALAEASGWPFRDVEDYYFPASGSDYKFSQSRSQEEVYQLLTADLAANENLIFAAVRLPLNLNPSALFTCAVWVQTPRETRLRRVEQRSFAKFGRRMLEGGDLYQSEKAFFDLVKARSEEYVSDWGKSLTLPLITVDGTKPVEENVKRILEQLQKPE